MKSYVYIIQAGTKTKAPIKVGVSDDPLSRLKQLQTGNPQLLRLLMTFECDDKSHALHLEKTLHEMMAGHAILNEWFSCSRTTVTKMLNKISNSGQYERVKTYDGIFSEQSARARDRKIKNEIIKEYGLANRKEKFKRSVYMDVLQLKIKAIRAKEERRVLRMMLNELGVNSSQIKERYKIEIGARGKAAIENIAEARKGLPIKEDNDTLVRLLGLTDSLE